MMNRTPGRPSKQDSRDTKQEILDAARVIIEQSGLQSLTIRAVADGAGVGTALVNYYFVNKQGLKEAVAIEAATEVQDQLQMIRLMKASPSETIFQGIRQFILSIGKKPYVARLILDLVLAGDQDVLQRLVTNILRPNISLLQEILDTEEGLAEFAGLDLKMLTPALMGVTVYPFVMAPLLQAFTGLDLSDKEELERYANHTARLLVDGLMYSGGSPRYESI